MARYRFTPLRLPVETVFMDASFRLGSHKLVAMVATTDADRAKEFYSKMLGLAFLSEDQFAVVFDACGTMLRVAIVRGLNPAPYTVLGWDVPDVAAAVESLRRAGITFEQYGFKGQDAAGIWTSPSRAKVAWFKDPDGNVLSITQFPPAG
jgi:catechol 2,3-dioxygenase-like lactoylglutathione lyase family enzyme